VSGVKQKCRLKIRIAWVGFRLVFESWQVSKY
jgi:hypothetical protein